MKSKRKQQEEPELLPMMGDDWAKADVVKVWGCTLCERDKDCFVGFETEFVKQFVAHYAKVHGLDINKKATTRLSMHMLLGNGSRRHDDVLFEGKPIGVTTTVITRAKPKPKPRAKRRPAGRQVGKSSR